jgi:hypothetical protein
MATRTYYPTFTRMLYELYEFAASKRDPLTKRSNFSSLDIQNFDALVSALQAATQNFPNYTEPV